MSYLPPRPHYQIILTLEHAVIRHLGHLIIRLPRVEWSELHKRWSEIDDPDVADAYVYGALAMYHELTHEEGKVVRLDMPA